MEEDENEEEAVLSGGRMRGEISSDNPSESTPSTPGWNVVVHRSGTGMALEPELELEERLLLLLLLLLEKREGWI